MLPFHPKRQPSGAGTRLQGRARQKAGPTISGACHPVRPAWRKELRHAPAGPVGPARAVAKTRAPTPRTPAVRLHALRRPTCATAGLVPGAGPLIGTRKRGERLSGAAGRCASGRSATCPTAWRLPSIAKRHWRTASATGRRSRATGRCRSTPPHRCHRGCRHLRRADADLPQVAAGGMSASACR